MPFQYSITSQEGSNLPSRNKVSITTLPQTTSRDPTMCFGSFTYDTCDGREGKTNCADEASLSKAESTYMYRCISTFGPDFYLHE